MISKFLKFIFATFIFILFLSCSDDDQMIVDNSINSIKVSTGEIYPEFNPNIKDYYITSINTLNNIQVTLENFNAEKTIFLNGVRVINKNTTIKLNINEDIVVKYSSLNNEEIIYTIHYLPEDLPKANSVINNNPSDGYVFVNYYEFSLVSGFKDYTYIAILNNNGFPVYYKKVPYQRVGNFNFHTIDGNQKRFSYGINNREIVLMDENFEEIKKINLLPHNGHGEYPADNHDFIYLNDNHYIVSAYVNRENVDLTAFGGINSTTLIDGVFQEIKNGQVIFEWNSANYPEIFNSVSTEFVQQFNTVGPIDYFHLNSISIDPLDNNFIVSARHTDQVYKIDRITGEIIWKLGGTNSDFPLNTNENFSHQHHATISKDGTLLLFDNNVTLDQKTRIVEYSINENTFDIEVIKEYHPEGAFMNIMGSVQKLNNNNFFIGWGGNTTSQQNASRTDLTEIDYQGNILLDISFTNNQDKFTYSYRALKYNISF
ncbi:hypothetical protein FIA58_017280 [Flavobacterium jejuense]|uniref:Arylsulfotransferase N-terminal domain-containing protein n=1 Tax=Flavobacterium jejuense TaxID=1544455 RepID=A0ABX0J0F2_9FLAO|nr:aryl-sulfate sulfotransferase [Flavobacterium jejuense]NHN27435.1 hypothetical protein [Flavobacterium jejuense]